MKVICKQTTSQGFDLKEVITVLSNHFDYSYGGYGLEVCHEYLVMGMAIYKDTNCLHYLIDTSGRPHWFPHLLFDIVDNEIPNKWFIKLYPKIEMNFVYMLCGFEELCNVEDFYSRLIDREESAIITYFKRKIELEKELEDKKWLGEIAASLPR